jgi:hypothetical protein
VGLGGDIALTALDREGLIDAVAIPVDDDDLLPYLRVNRPVIALASGRHSQSRLPVIRIRTAPMLIGQGSLVQYQDWTVEVKESLPRHFHDLLNVAAARFIAPITSA